MRVFIIVAIISLSLMSCKTTAGGGGEITDKTDSISYAIGRDIANSFQKQSVALSPEAFYAGLKESLQENKSLTDAEIQQLLFAFQTEMQMKQMQQQGSRKMANVSTGQSAPEISLNTPDGDKLSLSDLKGKYVLVDFWASWCKPCRLENPNVVRAYNKYKDKGFEILGVSLDRNRDRWLQAIAADGLTWKHVSDLKYFQSKAAVDYGVSAIPFTVLVDKDGKIIAQNLRGANLDKKLEELFGA